MGIIDINEKILKYHVFLKDSKNKATDVLNTMLDIISHEFNQRFKSFEKIDWKLLKGIKIYFIFQLKIH